MTSVVVRKMFLITTLVFLFYVSQTQRFYENLCVFNMLKE